MALLVANWLKAGCCSITSCGGGSQLFLGAISGDHKVNLVVQLPTRWLFESYSVSFGKIHLIVKFSQYKARKHLV